MHTSLAYQHILNSVIVILRHTNTNTRTWYGYTHTHTHRTVLIPFLPQPHELLTTFGFETTFINVDQSSFTLLEVWVNASIFMN